MLRTGALLVKLDREKYIFQCDSNKLACASYISLLKLRKQIEEQRAEGGKVIYALTFASQQKDLGCTAGGRLRRGRRTRRKSISRSAN